jgi:succinoglycan biosynthesis transport protein ExoP
MSGDFVTTGRGATVTFAEYFVLLRRQWRAWVICLIIGVLAAVTYNQVAPVEYTAKTVSFVTVAESASATSGDVFQGAQFAVQRVKSYAPLGTSPQVLEPVIRDLGLPLTFDELRDQIEVSSPPDTVLLEVSATSADPASAVRIADAVSAQLASRIHELETPRLRGASLVNVAVMQPAELPVAPSSPRKLLDLAIGAMAGAALGLLIALIRHHARRRIDGPDDIRAVTGSLPLGSIRPLRRRQASPLVALERRSAAAEEYRTIRSAISLGSEEWRGGFVVSSPSRRDGKSTVAANLAISWAQAGASVCLVDADLRDTSIARLFGQHSETGLAEVLTGTATLESALTTSKTAGVSILPAGQLPADPPSLLGSDRMSALARTLHHRFDIVIYDSPAMTSVTDALVLSDKIGGLVLVARTGATTRNNLAASIEAIGAAGQELIGVVATGVRPRGGNRGQYWSKPIPAHKTVSTRVDEPVVAPHAVAYGLAPTGESMLALPVVVSTTRRALPRTAGTEQAFG